MDVMKKNFRCTPYRGLKRSEYTRYGIIPVLLPGDLDVLMGEPGY
jgi:hypothetical protein